jgi:hypothetical protein
MICRFLPVPVPDRYTGPKCDLPLISRDFCDDNRIQGLLNLTDRRLDLALIGSQRRSCLVAPGRQCLLHFEQIAQALFESSRPRASDVVPAAGRKLRPEGRNRLAAGIIV